MNLSLFSVLLALFLVSFQMHAVAEERQHNVVLFVADGLGAMVVNHEIAPAIAALAKSGVWFKNSHSLFPTFTMPNSSALATGHYLGDTGVFGNRIYVGFPVPGAANSVTPFLENNQVLCDIDEHFGEHFLNEESLLAIANKAGFSTAAIGKMGPAGLFGTAEQTIVMDDSTGRKSGRPLSAEFIEALQKEGLPVEAPTRGENGISGSEKIPGTITANLQQQKYFADVTTKVILPRFKADGKPFVLVFWSRDPDGTYHFQGDSLGKLVPGINGPTSIAAIRNVDSNLAEIQAALKSLDLDKTTDIFIVSDHGFSTISKQSAGSFAARIEYADVSAGQLPPGFVAIDLSHALNLPLHDPDSENALVSFTAGKHPRKGNGLLGNDPSAPELVVAANGGSDLIYLPKSNARILAPEVVKALLTQDYVSGIFVDDSLGDIPGTLPLSSINLKGAGLTPTPAIIVNFRSESTGCKTPVLCTAIVSDHVLQQGQGMHGSFSRADTYNFMAVAGPDFNKGFVDNAPASNADVGMTIAKLLKLDISSKGKLIGRVLSESMPGGKMPKFSFHTIKSKPGSNGLRTVLRYQAVGQTRYFDQAGFPGRTVGLDLE